MTYGLPDPQMRADFYDGVNAKRAIAWVIDTALILGSAIVLIPFTAFTALFFFPVFLFVVGFIYRWSTLSGAGATWGMRMMGVELRDSDGQRLDNGTAFWHTIGYTVSIAVFPLQLVSVLMMLLSERNQGLTDHILGTAAINRML